jgi:hypothetical protein
MKILIGIINAENGGKTLQVFWYQDLTRCQKVNKQIGF